MIIPVMLVEDHKIVRQGLKMLLETEEDIRVVAQADDGVNAVGQARKHKNAIIVMDIALPNLNGLEAAAQILKRNSLAKIVILTAHADDAYIERALEIKVSGYLIKQCSSSLLIQTIREVNRGEKVYSAYIEERISILKAKNNEHKLRSHLSIREIQVLQMIAYGMTNKLISKDLNISIKTVEKHRQNLMKKLSIHDTASLTRYAIAESLIEASWVRKN